MYDTVTAASNAIGDFLHFADTAIARYVLDQKPDLRMCEPIDRTIGRRDGSALK